MRALVALLALTIPAAAQEVKIPVCAPHAEMVAALLDKAKESPVSFGISQDKTIMETFAAPDGKTWTIVKTDMLTGVACIKDFGTSLQVRPLPKKESGARL